MYVSHFDCDWYDTGSSGSKLLWPLDVEHTVLSCDNGRRHSSLAWLADFTVFHLISLTT